MNVHCIVYWIQCSKIVSLGFIMIRNNLSSHKLEMKLSKGYVNDKQKRNIMVGLNFCSRFIRRIIMEYYVQSTKNAWAYVLLISAMYWVSFYAWSWMND